MRGYTDGIQKTLSTRSMTKGMDYNFIKTLDDATDPIEVGDAITDELDEVIDFAGVKELIAEGYYTLDDGQELEIDGDELGYREDWYEVVNSLSEGGIYLICDTDKEVLGARMGAAGEHIGQVSVWVDTFNQTVTGWGETLPLSDSDCDAINETLNEMY